MAVSKPDSGDIMTSPANTVSNALTGPASLESNISKEHEYTHYFLVSFGDKTGFDGNIWKMVMNELPHVGRVDLVKLDAKIVTSASAQKVMIGFSSMTSTSTAEALCGKKNGFKHISTSYNAGSEIFVELNPEDTLSRQLQPQSADLPTLRLVVSKSAGADLWIGVYLKVRGIVSAVISLN